MDNRGGGLRNDALRYNWLNWPGSKAQRWHAIQARYHKSGAAECLSSDRRPTYCVAKRKRAVVVGLGDLGGWSGFAFLVRLRGCRFHMASADFAGVVSEAI